MLIEKVPLHERVYDSLRKSILNGELRPGERLNQNLLSEQFGVSRMPVRDALRMLENENLIEYQINKGHVVSTFPEEKLKDVQFVRGILEGQAVERAGDYITARDIKKLEAILEETKDADEKDDRKRLRKLNVDFHFSIYNLVPSPALAELINKLWYSFPKYILHEERETKHTSLQEHQEILDKIKAKDYKTAAELMRQHIATL
ncbi:MAG: GntR family transcriptional regulator [Oscillospiraceae bacterium]|nr:GntR family transcriptional regulator [Oscillospiraceae bacterium]